MRESIFPSWGPYTKRYAGVSHIANAARGIRFDLSVFPGLYRRKVDVPNVTWESGYHPWEASSDLGYFSFRHEVLWKDQVYADIAYVRLNEDATLVRAELVNDTDADENMVLHYMASIAYPTQATHSHLYRPLVTMRVEMPPRVVAVHALDYEDMGFAAPRPTDNLVPDAMKRGEVRLSGALGGRALRPLTERGDWVRYQIVLPDAIEAAEAQVRYREKEDEGFQTKRIPLGDLEAGVMELVLTSLNMGPVVMDSVLIGTPADLDRCKYVEEGLDHAPKIALREEERMMALTYQEADVRYGVYWDYDAFWVREILNSELDTFMRANVHHHTEHVMVGDRGGHFTNVFQRPIPLGPHEKKVLYGVVVSSKGSETAVFDALRGYARKKDAFEAVYERARSGRCAFGDGHGFGFGQERMAATTLTNVVYPVYRKGEYIRHNTPGRWWDCLYTWDSGFIGIGLNTIDSRRAMECLDTYLTEVGDEHCAFIHHGSMVPTQFYLMNEIWNETRSRADLEYAYPRLKQYYEFFVGRLGSSSTNSLRSGLLKTWDYFYNSGGWDDYPPQVYVHRHALEAVVTPVITTAQAIRCAKLMTAFAKELGGREEDIRVFEADVEAFTGRLDAWAYDGESGYYGYVVHDEAGEPTGILRTADGENMNKGLDGLQPMVAGIVDGERLEKMVALIMEEGRMWSSIGVSSVDQKASYFTADGYWNGAVWMPHQWFLYKALLDGGYADEAFRIAKTALEVWEREVEESYHCFEHFIVASKRGAGWHQFSGLSTPVLYWYCAYYDAGRLTAGLDVWVRSREFTGENERLCAEVVLSGAKDRSTVVVATMAPGKEYRATLGGVPVPIERRTECAVEVSLENQTGGGMLVIEPKR